MGNRIWAFLVLIAATLALLVCAPATAEQPEGTSLEEAYRQIFAPVALASDAEKNGVRPTIPAAPTYTYCCKPIGCCRLTLLTNCLAGGYTGWQTQTICWNNCNNCSGGAQVGPAAGQPAGRDGAEAWSLLTD